MEIKTAGMEDQLKTPENRLNIFIRKNITLRLVIQLYVVAVMLYSAWQFNGFYEAVQSYTSFAPERPAVVEGFLPIAAIVAFKAMFVTGEIDPVHPAGLVILLIILLTGWIFRRAVCSWICPLGTLSEYLGKLGHKVMGRNYNIHKWLDIPLLVLKYALFIYVIKAFILLPADYAASFMQLPYYTVSDVKMFELFLNLGTKSLAFIVVLMLLSFLFKNFWCRYLCPYGALVGLLSVFSPFVLKKNSETCINCGRCNKVCPSKVDIQGKKSLVISTECTGCATCVTECPKANTLEFKLFGIIPIKPVIFSVGFVVVFFGLVILAMLTGYWESTATLYDYQTLYTMVPRSGF